MADSDADYPTIIGADAVFRGHLEFEKGLRLLGTFDGEVNSKGQFVVAKGAKMTGEVHVGTILVEGDVKANLIADSKVHLSASGRLEGDIEAARLEVAEGAVLIGKCTVGTNGRKQPASDSKMSLDGKVPAAAAKSKGNQPAAQGSK